MTTKALKKLNEVKVAETFLKLEKKSKGVYRRIIGEEFKGIEITISEYGRGKWELSIIDYSKGDTDVLFNDFDSRKSTLMKILADFYSENKDLFVEKKFQKV